MDNRSYDPENVSANPLTPGDGAAGPAHELPTAVDPARGIVNDPAQIDPYITPNRDAVRPAYGATGTQQALSNQPPFPPQQPTGAAPPYTAAHPPQQYGVSPGPGIPPPPAVQERRGGFNWMGCCGITCGVLLVLALCVGVFFWKVAQKFKGFHDEMQAAAAEVSNADEATVKKEAVELDAVELSASVAAHADDWLAVTGDLFSDAGGAAGMFQNIKGLDKVTSYWMAPNVVVLDVSSAPSVGDDGDTIRAYGEATEFDLAKIPLFGKAIAEGMRQDPHFKNSSTVVLFIAKSVELVKKGEPVPDAAGGTSDSGGGPRFANGNDPTKPDKDQGEGDDKTPPAPKLGP